jgi:uncharacterized glyoxalase superfamily protein PhnB
MADTPSIYPALRYRDGHAASAFLQRAFGFEEVSTTSDDSGDLVHAELRLGNGMVMLSGGAVASPSGRDFKTADHAVYVVVDDADGHAARAREAGADIFMEPYDTPYGSREYAARDPEGHLWSFGTYVPGTYEGS